MNCSFLKEDKCINTAIRGTKCVGAKCKQRRELTVEVLITKVEPTEDITTSGDIDAVVEVVEGTEEVFDVTTPGDITVSDDEESNIEVVEEAKEEEEVEKKPWFKR